jgi:hypothetical protein
MQQSNGCYLKTDIEENLFSPNINLKLHNLAKTTEFKEQNFITKQRTTTQNFNITPYNVVKHSPLMPVKSIKDRPIAYHSKGSLPALKEPLTFNKELQTKNLKVQNPSKRLKNLSIISLEKLNTKLPIPSIDHNLKQTDPSFVLPTEDSYKKMTEFFNDIKGIIDDGTQSARGNTKITLTKSNDNKEPCINTQFQKTLPSTKKILVVRKPSKAKVVKNEVRNLEKKGRIKMSSVIKQQLIKNSKSIV